MALKIESGDKYLGAGETLRLQLTNLSVVEQSGED